MKILLIGSGGRENALAWKITSSTIFQDTASQLYCAPGNPGMSGFGTNVPVQASDVNGLLEFALTNEIDLTVVGPEVPLSLGIADLFRSKGLMVFGPDAAAAEIESSKVFAKNLMKGAGIPTASFSTFTRTEREKALNFVKQTGLPSVFKADGLAAGKGVIIASSIGEAESALDVLCGEAFGKASDSFVIEQFLEGEEVSVFCVTDGDDYLILPFSQDHKKIGEGDTGKNTGGMGAVAPVNKFMTAELTVKIRSKIIEPVLSALKDQGRKFSGCLYCGLIISEGEPYVIEFNCRFGDPETQAVLPLIRSDFLLMLIDSASGNIRNHRFAANELHTCCVVIASGGYPDEFEKGFRIEGLKKAGTEALIFHSGTAESKNGIVTSGGRVLSVTGLSYESAEEAARVAYEAVSEIRFKNMYYRKDIGHRITSKVKEN